MMLANDQPLRADQLTMADFLVSAVFTQFATDEDLVVDVPVSYAGGIYYLRVSLMGVALPVDPAAMERQQ